MRSGKPIVLAALTGVAGAALLAVVLPGRLLPRIAHGLLHLPGPGSGVTVFGSLVALIGLLTFRWCRRPAAVLVCGMVLGVVHSVVMPVLFPSARTVGTVGPLPLRVLAVWVLGAVLAWTVRLTRRRGRALRYVVPAACANVAFLLFYWAAIYPAVGKRSASAGAAVVLLLASVAAGIILGGCPPALLDRGPREG